MRKTWMQVVAGGIVVGSIFLSVFVAHGSVFVTHGFERSKSGRWKEPGIRQLLAQVPTGIMGPKKENIYLNKTAFLSDAHESWKSMLKELSGFIEEHKASNLSTSNKKLFETALEKLDNWGNTLFNTVKIMKNSVIKEAVRTGGEEMLPYFVGNKLINEKAIGSTIAPLKKLPAIISAFQQKLKPVTSGGPLFKDAPETITIKKLLSDYCTALAVMIEKALEDSDKLKVMLEKAYQDYLKENPTSKKS